MGRSVATGRAGGRILVLLLAVPVAMGFLVVDSVAAPAAQAFDEQAIVQLVNEARWADGSAGLVSNPDMDAVALAWAQQLAASGSLSHNPSYAEQVPGGWTAVAENVAQGYGSASAVMDGWMGSTGHRANILGGYTDIGVALIEGGGTTWGVQVFAAYPGHSGPAAPQAAPPPAAPAPVEEQPSPAAAEPSAVATPEAIPAPAASPTPSASPTRSPRPTPSATSDAIDLTADRGDPSPTLMLALGLGIAAVLIAVIAWYVAMRRRRGARS